jgi:hypothetical protein
MIKKGSSPTVNSDGQCYTNHSTVFHLELSLQQLSFYVIPTWAILFNVAVLASNSILGESIAHDWGWGSVWCDVSFAKYRSSR